MNGFGFVFPNEMLHSYWKFSANKVIETKNLAFLWLSKKKPTKPKYIKERPWARARVQQNILVSIPKSKSKLRILAGVKVSPAEFW